MTLARQGLRYAAVGAVATAAHYALLALLVEAAHAAPGWAAVAGAVLGAQVAFAGNRRFTFGHRGPLWPAWWRFQATAVLGAAVSGAVVALGVRAGWHYLAAQLLATGLGLLLTFAVNRRWSFAESVAPDDDHRA